MTEDKILKYVVDFINGNISKEDFAELDFFARSNNLNKEFVRDLIRQKMSESMLQDDTKYAIKDFPYNNIKNRRYKVGNKSRIIMYVAASVAILVLIALPYGRSLFLSNPQLISYYAGEGLTKHIQLIDGTTVTLNSGSRLSYYANYGEKDRQIFLKGEALFDVKHDERLPMKIVTGSLTVYDIGTKFRLCDYEQDNNCVLFLLEGTLSVIDNTKSHDAISLRTGQKVEYDKYADSLVCGNIQNEYTDIEDMELIIFDKNEMGDVARKLSRVYGKKIAVAPGVIHNKVFGVFNSRADSLETILNAIASVNDARVVKSEKEYKILK